MNTPRTDEMIESRRYCGMTLEFAIRLCRELEMENAELRAKLDHDQSADVMAAWNQFEANRTK